MVPPEKQLYDKLYDTAYEWIVCTKPVTPGSNDQNFDRVHAILAPDAKIEFGHAYFVSTAPHLQGQKSPQGFIDHMQKMTPLMKTWDIQVADITVDTRKLSAVVRADYYMHPKQETEPVRNEILFWVKMDDSGEKVVRSTEFIDVAATGALAAKFKALREMQASSEISAQQMQPAREVSMAA